MNVDKKLLEGLVVFLILFTSVLTLGLDGLFVFLILIFTWFFFGVIRQFMSEPDRRNGIALVFLGGYAALSFLVDLYFPLPNFSHSLFKIIFGSYLFYVGFKGLQTGKIWLRGIPLRGKLAFFYGFFALIASLILLGLNSILTIYEP